MEGLRFNIVNFLTIISLIAIFFRPIVRLFTKILDVILPIKQQKQKFVT